MRWSFVKDWTATPDMRRTSVRMNDVWLEMPEVSEGIEEVVNGEIQIMPAPKWKHATIIENLRDLMAPQIDRQLVRIVVSQFGLASRTSPSTLLLFGPIDMALKPTRFSHVQVDIASIWPD